jgi:hypothetical protein
LWHHGLSSTSAKAGQRFQAYLNGDLMASGRLVAPKGARVSGRVVEAKSGTGMGGAPVLTLELTDMEIGGQMYGLSTSQVRLTMEGKNNQVGPAAGSVLEFPLANALTVSVLVAGVAAAS